MRFFEPILAGATLWHRLIACLCAVVAIALTLIVCRALALEAGDVPIIVAPLGASAVLVFAVPASPLAQPWPVIGGNIVSTLVGVAAYQAVPDTTLAAGLAVGGAILVMSLLRCLHPPGGAAALMAVIGGHGISAAGYGFAFAPVGVNSIVLVAIALLLHRLTGHRYPHRAVPAPVRPASARFEEADIDAALAAMDDSFDISRDDLNALLAHAERAAAKRQPGPPVTGPKAG